MSVFSGRFLVHGSEKQDVVPVLQSDTSLSFWGGIDPISGVVIDQSHPLHGICVAGTILCLPSGRGSCTASQVLLELILNGKAPKALIIRDRDGLICVGALIAQSVFPEAKVLDIIQADDYAGLLQVKPKYGQILADGSSVMGASKAEVSKKALDASQSLSRASAEFEMTEEEQAMLDAAQTEAERRAAQCLIRYGHIVSDAPTYVDVEKAHIDGCTYIGPGGLQFVKRLVAEGGKVSIPTTLNSVSTDLRHWKRLGIVETSSQQAAIELANCYLALGCSERSFTCAPYLLDNAPEENQQIVWGESNAVVFANTVLGARTEKYADYLDICCAIVGKVPAVGVHLEENRQPKVLIDATELEFATNDPDTFSLLFPVLGHLCGSLSDGEVPLLVGMERYADLITKDHMKAFCAAFGTTGTSPLIHVAGVTPEVRNIQKIEQMKNNCRHRRIMTIHQLEETYGILDQQEEETPSHEQINLVALGNPHLSLSECDALQAIVKALPESQKKNKNVQIVACMSRVLYDQSSAIPTLREFGMEFVQDTCWCMLLEENGGTALIPSDPTSTILTNSGKYAHYGPGLTGRKFRLGSVNDCINAAVSGTLQRKAPSAFPWKIQTRSMSCFERKIPIGNQGFREQPQFSNLAALKQPGSSMGWSRSVRFVLSRLRK
jgi:predicted aconitase/predicted aconitase with swiveling domain